MKTSVLVCVVLALAACGKNEHAFAKFLEDARPAPRDAPAPPVDAAMPSLAQIVADAKRTKPTPASTPTPKPAPKKGGSCRHHDISAAGCDCTGIERIQPGRN